MDENIEEDYYDNDQYEESQTICQYKKLNQEELLFLIEKTIQEIGEIIGQSPQVALNMLMFYNFDKKTLENSYLVPNIQQIKEHQNLSDQGIFLETEIYKVNSITCQICEQENIQGMYLKCQHVFCVTCWNTMIEVQFSNFIPIVKCLEDKCLYRLPINELKSHNKFQNILIKRIIQNDRTFTWCPGETCNNIFQCNTIEKKVKCECGITFCSQCKQEKHYPIPCDIIKKFEKIDESNDHWVKINTQKCPQCNRTIQRTEGCNHLKCYCGCHFCYICGEIWQGQHVNDFYNCPNKQQNEFIKQLAQDMLDKHTTLTANIKLLKVIEAYLQNFNKAYQLYNVLPILKKVIKKFKYFKCLLYYHYVLKEVDRTSFEVLYSRYSTILIVMFYKLHQLYERAQQEETQYIFEPQSESDKIENIIIRRSEELKKDFQQFLQIQKGIYDYILNQQCQ